MEQKKAPFRNANESIAEFYRPEYDASGWPEIALPADWQVQDAGRNAAFAYAYANTYGLITDIKSGDMTILAPKDNATRAQIASIIMRFIEK